MNVILSKNRYSLLPIFSGALAAIMLLFVLLSWLTYSSLLEFRDLFKDVAQDDLPDIVLSSQLYAQSTRLLESTEQLANASSEAAKRLAEEKVSLYLAQLRFRSDQRFSNEFLRTQLDVIQTEINEFTLLIRQKLRLNQQLRDTENAIYALHNASFNSDLEGENGGNTKNTYQWSLQLAKTVAKLSQTLNMHRLQEVRGMFRQLNDDFEVLRRLAEQADNAPQRLKTTSAMQKLILAEDGFLALKIEHMRIEGRVNGRENFVHNLIQDYAQLLEYGAKQTEKKTSAQLQRTVARTQTETNKIGVILSGTILLLLLIILFMQRHVILRLQTLNNLVKNRISGKESHAVLEGNDEITDLATNFSVFAQTIEDQRLKLEHMTLTDSLTQIANRRALDIRLHHDIELSVRKKSHVAVLLMDIDCFKLYNDNYGHAFGDECLKRIAKLLKGTLKRASDFVARYGGEEFVCVLPDTSKEGAEEMAELILKAIRSAKLEHRFSKVTNIVTLSIGIAVSGPEHILLPEKLLSRADKALYRAKNMGKNRYYSKTDDQEQDTASP
ncbi:MAG: diguanylate cyclase [Paraglaciecola sp.]|nr:diguanylate cyclase [Paraglaciecola sp.]NCT47980.1 diguanylate cyclase [Paraglaciecola sp.]